MNKSHEKTIQSISSERVILTEGHRNDDSPVAEYFLLEESDAENETEVETDLKTDIFLECALPEYPGSDFAGFFSDAFTSYSFSVIKIEFLDVFSPPPNC